MCLMIVDFVYDQNTLFFSFWFSTVLFNSQIMLVFLSIFSNIASQNYLYDS